MNSNTNNIPQTVELLLFSLGNENLKDEVFTEALKLNNLQTIPFKIIRVVTKPTSDGKKFNYFLEVEDLIDTKEWDSLVKAFLLGYKCRHNGRFPV